MIPFPPTSISAGIVDPVAAVAAALAGACVLSLALAVVRRRGAAVPGTAAPGARRAVRGLARRGLTARAIASRTRLAQDAVRTLLALADAPARRTKGPHVPATRKFVPGGAAPGTPRSFREAMAQVVAPRSFRRA